MEMMQGYCSLLRFSTLILRLYELWTDLVFTKFSHLESEKAGVYDKCRSHEDAITAARNVTFPLFRFIADREALAAIPNDSKMTARPSVHQ